MSNVNLGFAQHGFKAPGAKFDSSAEHRRWVHLCHFQAEGLISYLRRQVAYGVVKSVKFHGASRPACRASRSLCG